jgi:hypothetical protein
MRYVTPDKDLTEGIALFNGNQMSVNKIKVIDFDKYKKDEYKHEDYLKDLKTREELYKEYKDIIL